MSKIAKALDFLFGTQKKIEQTETEIQIQILRSRCELIKIEIEVNRIHTDKLRRLTDSLNYHINKLGR